MVIVAQRTILGKSYSRSTKTKGPRPRSRTLTAVQDSILEVTRHPHLMRVGDAVVVSPWAWGLGVVEDY